MYASGLQYFVFLSSVFSVLNAFCCCCCFIIIIIIIIDNNNNNNNCYIALYPIKIYELTALYIINISIHLTIKTAEVL